MRACSRRDLLVTLAAMPAACWARSAVPNEVATALPGARLQGSGRITLLGLKVYDAILWVSDGFSADAWAGAPFALELEYARTLYGRLIAERSLDEMKRDGGFSDEQGQRWLAAMRQAFPDVTRGDRITGIHRPGEAAHFYFNGKPSGEVGDAEFARRFFGIWLAPGTSEPQLRAALLGPTRSPP